MPGPPAAALAGTTSPPSLAAHWRAEGRAAAAPAPGPRPLAENFPGGGGAWWVLTAGQVASLLACVLALVEIFTGLDFLGQLRERGRTGTEAAEFFVVATGLLHAVLWAAMVVVLGRAKAVANLAGHQDAENRRLWQAIDCQRLRWAGRVAVITIIVLAVIAVFGWIGRGGRATCGLEDATCPSQG